MSMIHVSQILCEQIDLFVEYVYVWSPRISFCFFFLLLQVAVKYRMLCTLLNYFIALTFIVNLTYTYS